ncbi:MAG: GxxExxY protein [Lentisphaerota bacterium]
MNKIHPDLCKIKFDPAARVTELTTRHKDTKFYNIMGNEYIPMSDKINAISRVIVAGTFKVHKALGPVYEICQYHELQKAGLKVTRQVNVPVVYDNIKFDAGFRLDLLVDEKVIVEIKAVDDMNPVFDAQVLTYLRLTNIRLGMLINFNAAVIKKGIIKINTIKIFVSLWLNRINSVAENHWRG